MTVGVIALYFALLVGLGGLARRLLERTGEDYFLASRSIGPFLLLMSLFGTHMTAFSLLGASGEAYHTGVGVFSLMASSSALVVPAVFLFVGTRVWELGRRHGFVTQVELFRARWGSPLVGGLLLAAVVALLVPYLLIGVMGGGLTLEEITGGAVPRWLGSLAVCAVVLAYVGAGGVRGTAWANALQTLVFMLLGAVAFAVILHAEGGLGAVLGRADPALLMHGERIGAPRLLSYTLIPLSVGMFPHITMHWLTARRAASFRLPIVAYPLCIAVVWVPSVLLGVIGTVALPGLEGPAANSVLVQLIDLHAPELLAGLLAAGVCAAVMSSLDSQVLALSTLFTRDVVRHHGLHGRMGERAQVLVGRLFVVAILVLTWALSLVTERSIFRLGVWSFTGFAGLFPLVVAALYWRRSTAAGAVCGLLAGAASWIWLFRRAAADPGYTVAGSGVMPVVVVTAATTLALVVGSLATRPPSEAHLREFFGGARG